jgi:hypothetical protein
VGGFSEAEVGGDAGLVSGDRDLTVVPAEAGTQSVQEAEALDSRLRGNDEEGRP